MKKFSLYALFVLMLLSLLTPFWVFEELIFPFITSKAFFFRIVIEAALPFYVFLVASDKSLRPKLRQPLNIAVLAFLVINAIASFTGVNTLRSLWGGFERMGGVYYLLHLVLFYFYLQLLGQAGENYLKRFLQAFIGTAVLVTLNGLSGWIGGPHIVLDPSLPARVSSTFGNPIFFASYLIIPMFLSAYFAVQEEQLWLRVVYWVAVGLQLLGIYSSGTRGAVVGLIVGLFVAGLTYVALTKRQVIRRYGLVIIGVLVLLGGIIYFNHNRFAPGSTLYRLSNLQDSNTQARLIQWKSALTGAKDYPLLGVGPENYYVIFDTYFNPEMYRYDASWFDKPHNFILEVLTTTGILGLLAYGAMFVFCLYGLWRAYKAEIFGLMEMCLLLGALITYQVQNLTVFDTVSPSVAFYAFLGLIAYVLLESQDAQPSKQVSVQQSPFIAQGLFAVVILIVIYLQYVSNAQPLWAAKRTNLGYAYTSANPKIAAEYFKSALSVGFNLDPRETANRYSDYASAILSNSDLTTKSPEFVIEQLDKAIANQRLITEKTENDPLLWMRLSIDEINQALVRNGDFSVASSTVEKTISLAPKRVELLQLRIQLSNYTQDWQTAVRTAREIAQLNPYQASLQWQVAMAEYLSGNVDQAVLAGDKGLEMGFKLTKLREFAWYIQYYQDKKDYAKVVPLLEKAVELEPNAIDLYIDLATAYAGVGDYDHARALAEQVMLSDPGKKAAMEAFIKTLK